MHRPDLSSLSTVVFTLFLTLALSACDEKTSAAASELSGDERPPGAANDTLAMARVEFTDLQKHDNGIWTHNGNLFSGQAVELAEDGETRVREFHYLNGRLHGPVREFYSDGSIMNDIRYEEGVPNGLGLEWDLEGNRTEIQYKDGVEVARFDKDSGGPKQN